MLSADSIESPPYRVAATKSKSSLASRHSEKNVTNLKLGRRKLLRESKERTKIRERFAEDGSPGNERLVRKSGRTCRGDLLATRCREVTNESRGCFCYNADADNAWGGRGTRETSRDVSIVRAGNSSFSSPLRKTVNICELVSRFPSRGIFFHRRPLPPPPLSTRPNYYRRRMKEMREILRDNPTRYLLVPRFHGQKPCPSPSPLSVSPSKPFSNTIRLRNGVWGLTN